MSVGFLSNYAFAVHFCCNLYGLCIESNDYPYFLRQFMIFYVTIYHNQNFQLVEGRRMKRHWKNYYF